MTIKSRTSGQSHSEGTTKITEPQDWTQFAEDLFCELSKYDYLRITPDTVIIKSPPTITYHGEKVAAPRNITGISGGSKSGKTAIKNYFIVGALSIDGNIPDPIPGLYVEPNPLGKAVIDMDTEQSTEDQQENLLGVIRRGGYKTMPRNYLSYNIRSMDIAEYEKTLTGIFEAANEKFKGIHIALIDGCADFILDVNDPVDSVRIVKYFTDLSEKYNTTIILLIHTNPTTGIAKERGHLGSFIKRKCYGIITVTKDANDITTLGLNDLRKGSMGISGISMIYDKDKGYHVSYGVHATSATNKDTVRLEMLKRLAKEVFAPPAALKDKDCKIRVMAASDKQVATAKNYLVEMRSHKIITQGEDGLWRLNSDNVV